MIMKSYMELLSNDFGACLVLSKDTILAEESQRILRDGRRKLDHAVRELLQKGMDDGSITPCDPRTAAAALFGAFNWVPHWRLNGNKESNAKIGADFIDIFLNGLRTRG
jgi:hypothetical protein